MQFETFRRKNRQTKPLSGFDALFQAEGSTPPDDIRPFSERDDIIRTPVGQPFANQPNDVSTLARNLSELGYLNKEDPSVQGEFTSSLDQGIRAFQKHEQSGNTTLKVDGEASAKTQDAILTNLKAVRTAAATVNPTAAPKPTTSTQLSGTDGDDTMTGDPGDDLLNRAKATQNPRIKEAQERQTTRQAGYIQMAGDARTELEDSNQFIDRTAEEIAKWAQENPVEAVHLAVSLTEPAGTISDFYDIFAGTASGAWNTLTGDEKNAIEDAIQAATGIAAVAVPFVSGKAIRVTGKAIKGITKLAKGNALPTPIVSKRLNHEGTEIGSGDAMFNEAPYMYKPNKFKEDYPDSPNNKPGDRVLYDMNGDLIPKNATIAGRRQVDGFDVRMSEKEIRKVLHNHVTIRPEVDGELDGDFGMYRQIPGTESNPEYEIVFQVGLTREQHDMLIHHEGMHAVAELVLREMPKGGTTVATVIKRHEEDFRDLFHTLNTRKSYGIEGRISPKNYGYKPGDATEHELIVEALRAYISNPAYIKKNYPELAKELRDFTKQSPTLYRTFRLNDLAPIAGASAATAATAAATASARKNDEKPEF